MAIAPEEGLTAAEARAATVDAQRAAIARNAADAQALEAARIAESDARLRARIPSSPNFVAPEPAPTVPVVPAVPKVPAAPKTSVTPVTPVTPVSSTTATQDLLLEQARKADEAAKLRDRQSAYDILYNEFNKYGLGALVEDIKGLIQANVSPSQFSL